MQRLLIVFTLLLISTPITANAQESGSKVVISIEIEDGTEVWDFWSKHQVILKEVFDGYMQKENEKVTSNYHYFANQIKLQNASKKIKGCQRGFFRCLPAGTVLDISVSMHPPLKAENNQERQSVETKTAASNSNKRFAHKTNGPNSQRLILADHNEVAAHNELNLGRGESTMQAHQDSLKILKDSLSRLKSQLEEVKKNLLNLRQQISNQPEAVARGQHNSSGSRNRTDRELPQKSAEEPQWWENVKVNYKHTPTYVKLAFILIVIMLLALLLYVYGGYILHEIILGKKKRWKGYDYMQ